MKLLFAFFVVGQATWADDSPVGKRVYEASCAPCHGLKGDWQGPAARYLEPRPRDFSRGLFKLRSTASGALPTDEDLLRVIDAGMPGSAMPPWRDALPLSEREAVVAYVESLVPRWKKARRPSESLPLPPRPSGANLAWEGRQVFLLLLCAECHGAQGRGDGPSTSTLKDDWGKGISPADFVTGRFRGGNDPASIVRVLQAGMNGTPMPSYRDAALIGREGASEHVAKAYVAEMPTAAEVAAMDDDARAALAGRRLWALAIYVGSVRAPRTVGAWLMDQVGRMAEP